MADSTSLKEDCWQDITEEFKASVGQLNLGELLKTEQFTLFEAMSAIELMDPKMDVGLAIRGFNRRILNLDQSIRAGVVKINNLEPNELIGIIDDTWACLVTWLDGHPLAQTVMTNLYLHDTERIEDRSLRIFSQAILRIVDFINSLVSQVSCIEEEDFQLNYGKFDLTSQVGEQKILNLLEDLCLHYEGQQQRSNINSSTQHIHDVAIAHRFRFTYNLYGCLLNVSKNLMKDLSTHTNQDTAIKKTVKSFQNHVNNCNKPLENCLHHLEKWTETIDLGIKPEERIRDDCYTKNGDYPTIMGFDPLANHWLIPPTYPRCPSIKSRPLTLCHLRDLINKLREAITLSNNFSQKSLNGSLDTIEQYSKYPKSCVISRSFMQILYLPQRIASLMKEALLQSMSDFCEPVMRLLKRDVEESLTNKWGKSQLLN